METVQIVKTENEKKKEYLWKYQESVRRIARIESELAEIRAMRTGISINYDSIPSGLGQSDLSAYVEKLDILERKLISERYRRIKLYQDISKRIRRLKDQNQRDVLFYRYIKGFDWWRVAEKMNYSERHITRLHGKALANFELPKDVLECPTNK